MVRDQNGAFRYLDADNIPLPPEVKECHRGKIAELERREGTIADLQWVVREPTWITRALGGEAAEQARFVVAYANVGIFPDCGTSSFLPRVVGPPKAMELYLFNKPVTAQQAQSLGVVNRVVASAELLPTVNKMAQRLAPGPTLAYGQTKRLFDRSFANNLADHLREEALSVGNFAASEDHVEAVAAFLAKRPAQFKGY